MNRRKLLKTLSVGSLAVAVGGGWVLTRDYQHPSLAVDVALQTLSGLNAESLFTQSPWGVARTFHHLAQSIEFSMTGYPEMRSTLFQNTAGSLAFSVFNARGRMAHGLDEIIPGEVVDPEAASNAKALAHLTEALRTFDEFSGELKPHFAYGQLSKEQYALAHVMHINNHFEEISPGG